MSFPYKNPLTSYQLGSANSVSRTSTFGTNFSILSTGGYMEVYYLSDLLLTLTATTYPSIIQLSANTIPIAFTKGTGSAFSPDVINLNSDNIAEFEKNLELLTQLVKEQSATLKTFSDKGN